MSHSQSIKQKESAKERRIANDRYRTDFKPAGQHAGRVKHNADGYVGVVSRYGRIIDRRSGVESSCSRAEGRRI